MAGCLKGVLLWVRHEISIVEVSVSVFRFPFCVRVFLNRDSGSKTILNGAAG